MPLRLCCVGYSRRRFFSRVCRTITNTDTENSAKKVLQFYSAAWFLESVDSDALPSGDRTVIARRSERTGASFEQSRMTRAKFGQR
jgi:hypothetical protein